MRFILKMAFFLGLIAFFIPFGGERPREANISLVGAFIGAQQAIADLTGFCVRAPQACDTGRELAVFAGERITDGAALAYSLVQDKIDARETAVAANPVTDPVNTGAVQPVAVVPGPMPYLPPKRGEAAAAIPAEMEALPAVAAAPARRTGIPAIPTPAPRV